MFDAIAGHGSWHQGVAVPISLPGGAVAVALPRRPRLFGAIAEPRVHARLDGGSAGPPGERRLFGAIATPRAAAPIPTAGVDVVLPARRLFEAMPAPLRPTRPLAAGGGATDGAVRVPAPGLFGALVRKDLGARLATRGVWTVAAAGVQAALIAGVAVLTAHMVVKREVPVLVEVKLVRPVVPGARPGPPPPAAAAVAPAPRRAAVSRPPTAVPKPPSRLAIHQPHLVPATATLPTGPAEEDGAYDDGALGDVEGGVIGGVVGGVPGGVVGGVFGGAGTGAESIAPAPPPPPAPAQARPVKFQPTMSPPVLVSAPPLEYPQQAIEREIEGTMRVECIVSVDGTVHACRVLSGLPYMDRAVISNLERRRYRPARLDGRPLDVQYTFTIRFELPQ